MNLRVLLTSAFLLTAAALVLYGLSPLVVTAAGLPELFSSFWKLEALALAFSITAGFAWPFARGLRKGDHAVATVAQTRNTPMGNFVDFQQQPVLVLDNGWKVGRVKVALPDGSRGEALVSDYAGAFSPATVHLVEREIK